MSKKKSRPEMHMCLSDQHYPFHDPEIESITLQFIKEQQPTVLHLLGDIIDFYAISRFDKDPARAFDLQGDIDAGVDYLRKIRDVAPTTPVVFSGGNHEDRLRKYLWSNAPPLASLRNLRIPELFCFSHFGIEWHDYGDSYMVGDHVLTHGKTVRKRSGYSARGNYEKFGCNVITGHTHRLGGSYARNMLGVFGSWENGCTCRLDPEYVEKPADWQHGFSIIWKSAGNYCQVDQVPIVNGQYVWLGEHYISQRRVKE